MNIDEMTPRQLRSYAFILQGQVKEAQRILTETGVPEIVEFAGDPVPQNSVQSRLLWFILRRKNVGKADLAPCLLEHEIESIRDFMSKAAVYGHGDTPL